ncbi:unnamed protein product, partial [Rotaria sp. Silwood1]
DRSFPFVTLESNRDDELSNLDSRLLDIRNEHQRMLLHRYEDKPLLSLEDAVEHLQEIIPNIRRNAFIEKERSTTVDGRLTQDESAAI